VDDADREVEGGGHVCRVRDRVTNTLGTAGSTGSRRGPGSANTLFRAPTLETNMVRLSTGVILAGVVLLFIPIPPIATILGLIVIAIGVGMRALTDK
jgi:hypothetical protein